MATSSISATLRKEVPVRRAIKRLKEGEELAAQLDFTLVAFTVVLPLVGFLWVAYARREQCLALLSEAKCLMLSTLTAHQQWVPSQAGQSLAQAQTQTAISAIVAAMHAYFLPRRFYSRRYPYFGYKAAMLQIAQDRARALRQVKDGVAALDAAAVSARLGAGLPPALEAVLHERTLRLAVVIDQMGNVKEFGTPQGVRSIARFYVCLVIPLFFAPYWAFVANTTNFALVFFVSNAVQISLAGLLNTAVSLEDPFDNCGMDGIWVAEHLYDVKQALTVVAAAAGGGGYDQSPAVAEAGQQRGEGGRLEAAAAGVAAVGVPHEVRDGASMQSPSRRVRISTDNV